MAMFTPRNQIRNMLDYQAAKSQINNPSSLEQMFGLFILSQQRQTQRDLNLPDNWMDDSDLWVWSNKENLTFFPVYKPSTIATLGCQTPVVAMVFYCTYQRTSTDLYPGK